jgi:hypothetical protein
MRLSFRGADGREITFAVAEAGPPIVQAALMMLSSRSNLEVGQVLSVEHHPPPREPGAIAVTPDILTCLATRLEAWSRILAMTQPEKAVDLQIAASLARYAVEIGWVIDVTRIA